MKLLSIWFFVIRWNCDNFRFGAYFCALGAVLLDEIHFPKRTYICLNIFLAYVYNIDGWFGFVP